MMSNFFSLSRYDEVLVAQVEALKRRVPILYGILSVNTAAMIATHWQQAPSFLTFYLPALFILIMVVRVFDWRRLRLQKINADQSKAIVRSTTINAAVLASAMLMWACFMYTVPVVPVLRGITGFGHAVLYVSPTVICCIFLLMHVRQAALMVACLVMGPFCIFLMLQGSVVEVAVALNIGLVTIGMLYVILVFSRDFEHLVVSRRDIRIAADHEAILASTDELTGLANRRSFFSVLHKRCGQRAPFSLFIIDLDGFKQINDLHGHVAGDEVLRQTAQRIADAYGECLLLARLGGDEFAIICEMLDPSKVEERARRVILACQQQIVLKGSLVSVGASIGAVVVGNEDFSVAPTKHIERADFALSYAKQHGKGRAVLFAPEHEATIRRQRLVEQTLRQADIENEVSVVYQPIVCAEHRRLLGFEALARWNSPVLGQVPPTEFVPLAELGDVIHRLTSHVLRTALEQASTWPQHARLRVNLSGRDIINDAHMLEIIGILEKFNTLARRLSFELTETSVVEDFEAVSKSIALIKSVGVSFAIDDFGTGYSSLSYIHKLAPDLIKIDRSFVTRIGAGDNVESIIKTIIELCRNLGAKSLAEGVETEHQVEVLKSLGADQLQGFLIAKPLSAKEVTLMFSTHISSKLAS